MRKKHPVSHHRHTVLLAMCWKHHSATSNMQNENYFQIRFFCNIKNLADRGFELRRRGDLGARQLPHQLHEDGRDEWAQWEDQVVLMIMMLLDILYQGLSVCRYKCCSLYAASWGLVSFRKLQKDYQV